MIERRMSETGNRRAPLQCGVCACEIIALRMEWAVGEERSRLSAGDPVDRGGVGLGDGRWDVGFIGWVGNRCIQAGGVTAWRPNGPEMSRPASPKLVSRQNQKPGWPGRLHRVVRRIGRGKSLGYPSASPRRA